MTEAFACTGKNCPFMRDVKRCTAPHCENRTPPTNADRIRAMSDEELAEFLTVLTDPDWHKNDEYPDYKPSTVGWLGWLRSPAEECAHGQETPGELITTGG